MGAAPAANSTKTAPGRPFQKGASGNPSGRPKKDFAFEQACRNRTSKALATIDAVMSSAKSTGAERIAASKVILEYGHGKPIARAEVEVRGDLASALEAMRGVG